MLEAISLLLFLGLGSSIVLAIASRVFYVYEDPKVLAVTNALPGANCGGCGYAGCSAAAEAIVAGEAPCNVCVAGGADVGRRVGSIMGMEVRDREAELSRSSCHYGTDTADLIFSYNGSQDCHAAMMLYGGSKRCPIGCIGMGSCVKACKFDAIHMGDNQLPIVDESKCVGCGACVEVCPKNIITLTSATKRIISEYRRDECTAPCHRACPTGIDIPGFIHEIDQGHYEQALHVIREKCPLPLVCGYICPAPCELACRRNFVDEGIAINPLKRFVADREIHTGKQITPYQAPPTGHHVAVIGGGAEGLTLSYYLARLGHQPTIFEAKPDLGGILRYVITEDRLPRDVLNHDIQSILQMGVKVETDQAMGRDFRVHTLLAEGYDLVVLTTGGLDSRKILQPSQRRFPEPIAGFHLMLDFLTTLEQGGRVVIGDHVMVVHRGLKGLEVAMACRKRGARRVTIVAECPIGELPFELTETKRLKEEGITVLPATMVTAIGGISDTLTRVALESIPDQYHRAAQTQIMDVDTLIASTARYPELVFSNASRGANDSSSDILWQTVDSFRTYPHNANLGLFTPPELGRVSDSMAVVRSILSGRRLARAIHEHLGHGVVSAPENPVCNARQILDVENVADVTPQARQRPSRVPHVTQSEMAWITSKQIPGLEEVTARKEAARCLQCGLICYLKEERQAHD